MNDATVCILVAHNICKPHLVKNVREIYTQCILCGTAELSRFEDRVVIDGEQHIKPSDDTVPHSFHIRTREAYKSSPMCLLTLSYFISQRE